MIDLSGSSLVYSVRPKIIAKYFGQLCLVLAVINLVPLTSSIIFFELDIAQRYCIVMLVYTILGLSCARMEVPRNMQANEGMALIVCIMLFTCVVTAYPLMGKGLNFVDAFFEVASGITATGLSTVTTVTGAPRSFLFERVWMQWYGTLGFVTVAVFLVMQPGLNHKLLDDSQVETKDLAGGTRAHALLIIKVSCTMLVLSVIGCLILGLEPFNALLYGMAASCTGGFSPHDSGLADLKIPLQIWLCIICFFSAIPLTIYGRYLKKARNFKIDLLQAKILIFLWILISIIVGLSLHFNANISNAELIKNVPIFVLQSQTATGFTTELGATHLDPGSKFCIILSMLIGGCVGSTAGGMKILRLLFFIYFLNMLLKKISMPRHAIYLPKIANLRIQDDAVIGTLVLIILFFMVITLSWFAFLIAGYDPLNSLFEIVSAISTTGLSVGVTNESLPLFLKGVLCADMLFGRLEIIAWLVMLYPGTWFGMRSERK